MRVIKYLVTCLLVTTIGIDLYAQNTICPTPGGTQNKPPTGVGGLVLKGITEVISAVDPNEIIGPDGVGTPKWVSVHDVLPYTILFENSRAASAPAKYIKITYPIDAKQDRASFNLGSFGFNSLSFSVPASTASYYQRLDCRDSLGLYVDVTAGLDVMNNQAFWEFQSIDPVTLLPPADPLKGFLLLQDSTSLLSGHGFVNFTIKPVTTAHTLDTIHAQASIVFDNHDTIPTNYTKNTIDALPPTTHMNSLPVNSNNTINLGWTGADDPNGSGIQYYTLYVSTDGTNFNVLRSGITRTDTTFEAATSNTYYFFVLGTDSVGNTEQLRPGEIRSTFIFHPLPVTWLYFRGSNQGKDNFLEWATASEQNSQEFRIERSTDGVNFSTIGTKPAAGNSSTTITYSYKDLNVDRLGSTVMYYRLKQMDIDGHFKFSNVIRLTLNTLPQNSILYPNPTAGMVTIAVGDKSLIGTQAAVFDQSGRMVESVKISANTQTINMERYLDGIYYIRLANKEVLKVVKQ